VWICGLFVVFETILIMQEIVANVDHITFSIEKMLEQQTGAQALMFPGMDSK